jgi:hypothetical protein
VLADHVVGQRHDRLGPPAEFGTQRLSAREMFETRGRRELFEAIGVNRRARRQMPFLEGGSGLGF